MANPSYDISKCNHCLKKLAVWSKDERRVADAEVQMVSNELGLLDRTLDPSEMGWRQSANDYFKSLEIVLRVLVRSDNIAHGKKLQMSPKLGAELHEPGIALHYLKEAWPLLQDIRKMSEFAEEHWGIYKNKIALNGYAKYLEPLHPEKRGFLRVDPAVVEGAIRKFGNKLVSLKILSVQTGYNLSTLENLLRRKPELNLLFDQARHTARLEFRRFRPTKGHVLGCNRFWDMPNCPLKPASIQQLKSPEYVTQAERIRPKF